MSLPSKILGWFVVMGVPPRTFQDCFVSSDEVCSNGSCKYNKCLSSVVEVCLRPRNRSDSNQCWNSAGNTCNCSSLGASTNTLCNTLLTPADLFFLIRRSNQERPVHLES
nr:hypothetical protein Iba_chr10aCG16070 [Ipomoea batatas]GMD45969.1 hypothetical protein Iba_chr10dCG15100 [Ipomoea batatas]